MADDRWPNTVYWPDSEIKNIEIDYDNVVMTLTQPLDRLSKITFAGYIGFSIIGHWDESVIESCSIHEDHEFLEKCISESQGKYKGALFDSGNEDRNRRKWSLADVLLIDGTHILVAAHRMTVESV